MKKQKLIYVANVRLPTEKAHGVQIVNTCSALASLGADVELVVAEREKLIDRDIFDFYKVPKNFKIVKLKTMHLWRPYFLGFWVQRIYFTAKLQLYLFWNYGYNCTVYSRDSFILFSLTAKAKRKFWEAHVDERGFFVWWNLKILDGIVTISNGLKNFYAKKFNGEILVAPSAVDVESYLETFDRQTFRQNILQVSDRQKVITYIGAYKTMGVRKGVEESLQTFIDLYKQGLQVFLLLIGIGEEGVEEIGQILKNENIPATNFLTLARVPNSAVKDYARASDILLMPFPALAHYRYYMSPVKLFEYMASGVPIIATNLESIKEIISESEAYLVNPESVEEIKSAVNTILKNGDEAKQKAEKAKEKSKQFSFKSRAEKILNYLEKSL